MATNIKQEHKFVDKVEQNNVGNLHMNYSYVWTGF